MKLVGFREDNPRKYNLIKNAYKYALANNVLCLASVLRVNNCADIADMAYKNNIKANKSSN